MLLLPNPGIDIPDMEARRIWFKSTLIVAQLIHHVFPLGNIIRGA